MSRFSVWFRGSRAEGPVDPDQADPDQLVEAGYVPLWISEMVLVQLRDAGIVAHGSEERLLPAQGPSMARILCRASDLAAARRIIDDAATP